MGLRGLEVRSFSITSTQEDMLGILRTKVVELNEDRNDEQMWEQVKWALIDRAREMYGSVRVEGKSPKNVRWNNVKVAIERKEDAWKKVLRARDEVAKESCMEAYKEEQKG